VDWPEVLDDMEDRLHDVDRELSTGGPPVRSFALPSGLGPLPAELRQRSTALLRETLRTQAAAEAARERVADAMRQGRATTREPAAYFDSWA
jgi:hypothetical protein